MKSKAVRAASIKHGILAHDKTHDILAEIVARIIRL